MRVLCRDAQYRKEKKNDQETLKPNHDEFLYQRTSMPAYSARGSAGENTGVLDDTDALSA